MGHNEMPARARRKRFENLIEWQKYCSKRVPKSEERHVFTVARSPTRAARHTEDGARAPDTKKVESVRRRVAQSFNLRLPAGARCVGFSQMLFL